MHLQATDVQGASPLDFDHTRLGYQRSQAHFFSTHEVTKHNTASTSRQDLSASSPAADGLQEGGGGGRSSVAALSAGVASGEATRRVHATAAGKGLKGLGHSEVHTPADGALQQGHDAWSQGGGGDVNMRETPQADVNKMQQDTDAASHSTSAELARETQDTSEHAETRAEAHASAPMTQPLPRGRVVGILSPRTIEGLQEGGGNAGVVDGEEGAGGDLLRAKQLRAARNRQRCCVCMCTACVLRANVGVVCMRVGVSMCVWHARMRRDRHTPETDARACTQVSCAPIVALLCRHICTAPTRACLSRA